jgi:hypothetical protein
MAIQEIVSAIDAYIDRLKAARELLASLYTTSETINKEPKNLKKGRGKPQSIHVPVPPPSTLQVAVQIVPARVPRRRQRLEKPVSQRSSALGGPVPKGPVVIRLSELARMRSESGQAHPAILVQRPAASSGGLEELAQEVAKRLASGGSFPHRV